MAQGGNARRFTALVVVVTLHLLFLLLLLVREPILRRVAHGDPSSVLFFIDAPRPTVTTTPPVQSRSTQAAPPTVATEPSASEQTSIAPSTADPSATIDWTAQAAESAAAVVDKAIREDTRKC